MINESKTQFEIKTETFEGPLDLLLRLIEEQKLDITQVSLASVADGFINHINDLDEINLKHLSEFLDIASKLILAKSKVLLPQLDLTEEEQEDLEELENRLKEYQAFKNLSKNLKELADNELRAFSRKTKITPKISVFDPPNIDHKLLLKLFNQALIKMPKEPELPKASIEKPISMEDKIKEIKDILKSGEVKFGEFLGRAKTKVEVIVGFLAILELLKLKFLEAKQDNNFSEILLIKKEQVLEKA